MRGNAIHVHVVGLDRPNQPPRNTLPDEHSVIWYGMVRYVTITCGTDAHEGNCSQAGGHAFNAKQAGCNPETRNAFKIGMQTGR